MKKLILSVAVLAAFASCSKDEVTSVASSQLGSEIGFSTLNDRVTKSANEAGASYQVFAVQSTETGTAWYINETVSDANIIESGNKYYWPVDGSTLAFYAYAPASSETITDAAVTAGVTDANGGTAASAAISIAYQVNTTASEDFTVAAPIATATADATVELKFSHMLSKVNVTVALSEALTQAGYKLVDTDGTSVYATSLADTPSTYNCYTVDFGVTNDKGDMDVTATSPAWSNVSYSNASITYSGATSYMIMPQAASGCSITIKGLTLYATNSSSVDVVQISSKDLDTYQITGIDMADFAAGTQYNITMTIDGSADTDNGAANLVEQITFSATDEGWGSSTITVYATDENYSETTATLYTSDVYGAQNTNVSLSSVTYTSGYYIYVYDEAAKELVAATTSDDIKAINNYLNSNTDNSTTVDNTKANESVTGTYTVENGGTITVYQVIDYAVYSVNNSKYVVATYTYEVDGATLNTVP